ncbi:MAG: DUF3581 domain-containing protein [Gammaproteobacteria bacterium]|nr:DUF3581 domain-containing protein [Gammaproteobacteria bacterium]
MFLNNYYNSNSESINVSRQQASDFAKKIAGDFNPIHDEDAKRFCVPGDLLFALVLNNYGLSQHMNFTFSGMVGDGVDLVFPEASNGSITISDSNGKDYLSIEREGDTSNDPDLIQTLTRRYVEFSGQTFPHILVPLMAEHKVMINPDRPLVIYESMSINMNRLDIKDPQLELSHSTLDVDGKRGSVCLEFILKSEGEVVGTGKKNMVLSGLREFEQETIDQLVNNYAARKESYIS